MNISFSSYPKTIEEFIAIRDAQATTVEGAAACWCLALLMFSDSTLDPLVGRSALIAITHLANLSKSTNASDSYKGYTIGKSDWWLIQKIRDQQSHVARSYFAGTSINDDYALPATLSVHADATSNKWNNNTDNRAKVFVTCNGADTARPLGFIKNDKGLWKCDNWSSLLVGVKSKPKPVSDDI